MDYRKRGIRWGGGLLAALVATLLVAPAARAELRPDEVALVVNGNAEESVRLAELYCQLRGVPAEHVVRLSLPASEEIPYEVYEREVVPALRRALREKGLEEKVRCLVTFYGTPLRIAARQSDPRDQAETEQLQQLVADIRKQVEPIVVKLEGLGKQLDASFAPASDRTGFEDLTRRADAATRAISGAAEGAVGKGAATTEMMAILEQLSGAASIADRMAAVELAKPGLDDADRRKWQAMRDFVDRQRAQLRTLADNRWDPAARGRIRQIVRQNFGLLEYARIVQSQLEYAQAFQSVAAFDNELALLWWDFYPRSKWQANPLHWQVRDWQGPRVLMTARLDAPDAATVQNLMRASLKAEQEGLKGNVVIDSRGIGAISAAGKPDPFGMFDQHLRNLANLLKTRTTLPLVLDEKPEVLPTDRVKDVALYCGWYAVRNYNRPVAFVPGAVGYHVASFELLSLKREGEKGWVRGMLNDGVAATMGAVDEPYLHVFPLPDEFFPMLLTGEYTLAEVYWRTNPTVSWMLTMIGDPLYRPFAKDPPLKVEHLPVPLRAGLMQIEREARQRGATTAPVR